MGRWRGGIAWKALEFARQSPVVRVLSVVSNRGMVGHDKKHSARDTRAMLVRIPFLKNLLAPDAVVEELSSRSRAEIIYRNQHGHCLLEPSKAPQTHSARSHPSSSGSARNCARECERERR